VPRWRCEALIGGAGGSADRCNHTGGTTRLGLVLHRHATSDGTWAKTGQPAQAQVLGNPEALPAVLTLGRTGTSFVVFYPVRRGSHD